MNWKKGIREGINRWIGLSSNEEKFIGIQRELTGISADIDDELIVMIAGEFKSGKTTFINALLGEEVLSSSVTPETAMVTKLKYGEEKKVVGHFVDGSTKEYDPSWLEELTAEREGKSKFIRTQLAFVEYYLPFPILQTFTIVDSPGLTSLHKDHTRATEQFLKRADVAIWLFHSMNVGTSTELDWLKKLQEYDIKPIALVNHIDQLDDDEDELESFLDFNYRRLYPLVDELIGVSAKEALTGKLENDPELLEWSNWGKVEELFQNLKGHSDQKAERVFQRLKEPLAMLDQVLLEEKATFFLQKNFVKIKEFHSYLYPSLMKEKEQIQNEQEKTDRLRESWLSILKTAQNSTTPEKYKDSILSNLTDSSKRKNLEKNWGDQVVPKLHTYQSSISAHQKEYESLVEERKVLEDDWSKLYTSRYFNVGKIEKYAARQDQFNRRIEKFTSRTKQMKQERRELDKALSSLDKKIESVIQADIDTAVNKVSKRMSDWNERVDEIKISYQEVTLDRTNQLVNFFAWIRSFIDEVKPFMSTEEDPITSMPSYNQSQRLLEDIEDFHDDFPYHEFRNTYASFQSLPHLKREVSSPLTVPGWLSGFLPPLHMYSVPSLKHDPDGVMRAIRERWNKWIGRMVGLAVVAFIAFTVFHQSVPTSSDELWDEDSSYMEDDDQSLAAEQVSDEVEDSGGLEELFDREDVQELLTLLHNEMESPSGSLDTLYSDFFTDEGWEEFLPFQDVLIDSVLEEITGEDVEYSSDAIYVTTTERYSWQEAERSFSVRYSLIQDEYDSDQLKVSGITYSLKDESFNEFAVDQESIYAFMDDYRSEYMKALNAEDFSYVEPYFSQGTVEYQEMQEYFLSLEGKGYVFEPGENQVTDIMYEDKNQYTVNCFETFTFVNDKGVKTYFERKKEYKLKAVADNDFVIDDIIIQDTQKEIVEDEEEEASSDDTESESDSYVHATREEVTEMLINYYREYEEAFNSKGFSYVEHYYEPNSDRYMEEEAYLSKAIAKNISMRNLDFEVKSMDIVDNDTFLATVHLEDEYHYQDKPGEKKNVRIEFLIDVTGEGSIQIADMPYFNIMKTTPL
ncbi:dynamin family protein [Bacillus sp. es.034]|uniref:dynamin family protein n=1 Tax=Bacillus sp. es.034 TaxID=1761763 RepID=UPI000BF7AF78|nr:dynamin family protein [Bacillus sp. es.034]PFG04548.1 dynamin family protein [Bacillus sp. es.034]